MPYVEALCAMGVDHDSIDVHTPADHAAEPQRAAAQAGGLVFCGGPDLEPQRYGEEPLADANLSLMPELDALEFALLEGAEEARTPVWGICRGMQLLNVYLGGTLHQDLALQHPGVDVHHVAKPLDHLAHRIEVKDRSVRIGERLADEEVWVNTRHHQAVARLAPGVRPVASSPDGVLEVMTVDSDWWIQAVQWHPENLVDLPLQRTLWADFLLETPHGSTWDGQGAAG